MAHNTIVRHNSETIVNFVKKKYNRQYQLSSSGLKKHNFFKQSTRCCWHLPKKVLKAKTRQFFW